MLINELIHFEEINKGWSGDKKYCATDKSGNKYLLRISDASEYERKKLENEYMCYVAQLGAPICKPIEFGICERGAYSIQSWIEGEDAEAVMKDFAPDKQYAFGVDAGKILKTIHTITAPNGREDWALYFNKKADRKIAMYNECPVKYQKGGLLIDYINSHRHLLDGRTQAFHHGDFHIGNMMIDRNNKLFVIDFNRFDFGDPWEEFNRIVWSAQASPSFARGMVDGYFENNVPYEFWQLLALYISSNTLGSLPWAVKFGGDEINTMMHQADQIFEWYDDMKNVVPKWYTSK